MTKYQSTLFVVLFIAPIFAFAETGNFTRSLTLGMSGSDVRSLQIFLNTISETLVASLGAGSPGNETDYFGPATKRALIKFQEKYRNEVLTPVGLTVGSGFFGEKTRAKVSELQNKGVVVNPLPVVSGGSVPNTPSNEATSVSKSGVFVMFPSQYSGKPGTIITISGMGFTSTDNTIYFGDNHAVVQALSRDGQSIPLKIPQIPKGNYHVWVKNASGESNKDSFFVVTDGVTPEPKIESISPLSGGRGTTITITGSGLTAKGNMVRLGTNIFEGVPSLDGRSLTVTIPTDTLVASGASPLAKTVSIPIWIFVVNENGVSNGKDFTLKL